MTQAYIRTPQYIQVFVNNKPYFADNKHPNFDKISAALDNGKIYSQLDLFNLEKVVERTSKGDLKVTSGGVFYRGTRINGYVADRILEFLKNGNDVSPLTNFLARLLNNPNKHIFDNLYKFLELYKLPIDKDGFVYGLKAVQHDLRSKWDHNFQYVLNQTSSEPRQLCLTTEQNARYCGPGLWFGWQQFCFGYGQGDNKVIVVRVDPADIIATPDLESYQKIAACAITPIAVLGDMETARKNFGFTSNVAEQNVVVKQAINNYNKVAQKPKRDKYGRFVK